MSANGNDMKNTKSTLNNKWLCPLTKTPSSKKSIKKFFILAACFLLSFGAGTAFFGHEQTIKAETADTASSTESLKAADIETAAADTEEMLLAEADAESTDAAAEGTENASQSENDSNFILFFFAGILILIAIVAAVVTVIVSGSSAVIVACEDDED